MRQKYIPHLKDGQKDLSQMKGFRPAALLIQIKTSRKIGKVKRGSLKLQSIQFHMRIKNFAISRIEKQLFCPCRDGSFKESCKIFERQTTEINKIKKNISFNQRIYSWQTADFRFKGNYRMYERKKNTWCFFFPFLIFFILFSIALNRMIST